MEVVAFASVMNGETILMLFDHGQNIMDTKMLLLSTGLTQTETMNLRIADGQHTKSKGKTRIQDTRLQISIITESFMLHLERKSRFPNGAQFTDYLDL